MTEHRRILIIDDDDDIRQVAALALETVEGWQVMMAGSGADGICVAAREKPDAILLDVMMPDKDGPTTFKELQEDPETAGIPVLLLTAKVHAADQTRFSTLGVKTVLAKPFDPLTLGKQISECLGWKD